MAKIETDWTMAEVMDYYCQEFISKGYVKTKADAVRLLAESLMRSAVFEQVDIMALFIADEDRYYREQYEEAR